MSGWNGYIAIEFMGEASNAPLVEELDALVDEGATETFERKHQAVSDDHKHAVVHATWAVEPYDDSLIEIVASAFGELPENVWVSEPGDFAPYGTIYLFYTFDDLLLTALVHIDQAAALAYKEAFPWSDDTNTGD